MEIFKLFESTLADLQSADNIKHLRRDQLQDNCEASAKTLQTLIRAKESEIAYRKDLIRMLEESKCVYDAKLVRVKQDYQTVKSNAPATLDIKSIGRLDASILNERSTTPPMPPPPTPPPANKSQNELHNPISNQQQQQHQSTPSIQPILANNHQMLAPQPPQIQMHNMVNSNQIPGASAIPTIISNQPNPIHWTPSPSHSSTRGSDMDLSIPALNSRENHENRTSLDRRLSEFLKTFPNISQAGLVPPSSIDTTKPPPGYYTQQQPQSIPPPPPVVMPPPPQPAATSGYQHHYHHNNSRSIEK